MNYKWYDYQQENLPVDKTELYFVQKYIGPTKSKINNTNPPEEIWYDRYITIAKFNGIDFYNHETKEIITNIISIFLLKEVINAKN